MVRRSNTLPIEEPQRSNTSKKTPARSATVLTGQNRASRAPVTAPPTTHSNPKHSIFHRHDNTTKNASQPTSHNSLAGRASSSSSQAPTTRPLAPQRQNSVQTRYMTMLLALDTIPRLHNILASFFTWILLAGFVIFPGTFTKLSSLEGEDVPAANLGGGTTSTSEILRSVKNIPLLAIAGACCGIGAAGMVWLWWRWRMNYVWLLNRIFLPGALNSLAGLISTLINVYTQQDRNWSVTARVTAIVTGSCMVVLAGLFALYNFWVLKKVKKSHGRDMARWEGQGDGEEEGFMEKVERKAKEPALEPGSVV